MKLCCNIIRDLLPLYIDGIESDESRDAIKEHLKYCPDCRKYYKSINKALSVEADEAISGMHNDYKKISKKIRRRRALYAGTAAAMLLASVTYSVYSIINDQRKNY